MSSQQNPQQRRTLAVLVGAQVLSGAGLAAGITVGALLAQDMLETTSLAGLPSAMFTIGSAAAAVTVGRISQRLGRRTGLTLGYAAGSLGSLGVVAAAVLGNIALLFLALFVYGAGTATNLQARYAGADLASAHHRGRAVSTVLVATTVGAVVGPNLVTVMGDLATRWGIPALSGPFVLSAAAYALAALVLWVLLRPDPLLLARTLAVDTPNAAVDETAPAAERTWSPAVVLGATVMVVTQLVMVAIMTMTPIHMQHHGHSVGAAGMVIAVHVGAMYLPSPLSGLLVDRLGPRPVAAASALTLLAAGITAAAVPASSVPALALALGLLGLGWNLGLVSGTTIITDEVPLTTRARTQGTVDLCIAVAGAGGGLTSGMIVAATDYTVLAVTGGVIALSIVPALALSARMKTKTNPLTPANETATGSAPR
ncbi:MULTISPECIES: MFS transporter [Rhodococcus]|uniref:MFS transporter n=1 Tax=Rhodococcus oxybenzonivorans TaxID=1990687 RepID=A0AAE4V286_9NOCA|nr:MULTISPECIES: MFS transporter [Rhodococcus]MDV7241113.1 MFS transporter [Rhodococcus oxybenzonivorans]MDV7266907.1 MFS transporter [Rhodococcus oxybenzonivorans]MDV7273386.1 MFS transporter [Rhodococcus oxybenzonivorans]MDV7332876.1 MFS transporter [Rhodococcus oxybenzonivorans]MDV7342042.1 MFS transporter [Rhodococcus oxybenzonivorans]